jgi:exonuclease V gamma subunit
MPIICFEGASAVGKTTTAKALEEMYGAFVVPEVNQLFVRPENEPVEWYFERQVERWRIALENSPVYELVVLDGDPFQPLWYNWAYDFIGWQKLDFMKRFYQSMMENEMIAFPQRYFIFSTTETELRKRRASDARRQRRHFEIHLKIIEPMRRYFEAMRAFAPDRILFLEAETVKSNSDFIRWRVPDRNSHQRSESEFLLNKMVKWLQENRA